MRFFKYGEKGSEVLAIVLPGSVQRAAQVREGDEYEFIELAPGAFFLASKQYLSETARSDLVARLGQKMFSPPDKPQQAKATSEPARRPDSVDFEYNTPEQHSQQPSAAKPSNSPPAGASAVKYEQELGRTGFLVVEDEEQAKAVSKALEPQIKQGLVLGVRGFDKRFYIVTREFYESNAGKILKGTQPKTDCTPGQIAGMLKTSESGALAVLQVMKEEGDVLEKRRGVFQLVR